MLDLLTQFIRYSPVIAFIKDQRGRYLHVSDAWLAAFHTTRDAIEGKTDHELFDAAQADDFVKNDREVLASGRAVRRFERVVVPPEVRTFYSTKFPLFGGGDGGHSVAGFAIDVTDQQRTLEELERQKRFLERTQALATVGGFEFEVATGAVVCTSETYRLLERDEQEGPPTWDEVLARFRPLDRDALRAAHDEAVTHGQPYRLEAELLLPSARRRRVFVYAEPELADGTVRRLSGAMQDVTEARLVEEKLRHSSRMDAVGQLAAGVAHDFNNMLGAIVAAAELLRLETLNPAALDALNTIFTAATQAAGLTRQLLVFGRPEASPRVPTDLHAVLQDALQILQRTIDRRIALVVEPRATRSRLLADAPQLSSALINLALNARDAMPDGGTLTFRTRDDGPETLVLEVADTGLGMSPEVLSQIFVPFFTTKERGRGTGLGLATVDSAMRAHDGDLSVKSEVGNGTTFTLRFPLLAGGLTPVPSDRPPAPPVKTDELILIVDDEALVRRSMRKLLEGFGYRVLEASGGARALELVRDEPEKPALVVLDLMMPGLKPTDALRALRERMPQLPVLLCSGFAPADVLLDLSSQPYTGRLAKPFSAAELSTAVRALLPPRER